MKRKARFCLVITIIAIVCAIDILTSKDKFVLMLPLIAKLWVVGADLAAGIYFGYEAVRTYVRIAIDNGKLTEKQGKIFRYTETEKLFRKFDDMCLNEDHTKMIPKSERKQHE